MNFDWLLIDGKGASGTDAATGISLARVYEAPKDLRSFVADVRKAGLGTLIDLTPGFPGDGGPRSARWPGPDRDAGVRDDPRDPWDKPPVVPDLILDESGRAFVEHMAEAARRALDAGVRGLRCRYAHSIPAATWRTLFDRLREADPEVVLVGDAIGADFSQVLGLAEARFDFIFNSACWWDFRSDWLVSQLEASRGVAPTVTFPESPVGPRLAASLWALDSATMESVYRSLYLFSAALSAGVLMPMGYEFGLDDEIGAPAVGRPAGRFVHARKRFDISALVGAVNRLKAETPALSDEGRFTRLSAAGAPALVFQRLDAAAEADAQGAAIVCLNPGDEPRRPIGIERAALAAGGGFTGFEQCFDSFSRRENETANEAGHAPLAPFETRVVTASCHRPPVEPWKLPVTEEKLRKVARQRVIIEEVEPTIDGGRFAVKRLAGDRVAISADIFSDGHEEIGAVVKISAPGRRKAVETALVHQGNDRWAAEIVFDRTGVYHFTIEAWRDAFGSWRSGTEKKRAAGQNIDVEIEEGSSLVVAARDGASGRSRAVLAKIAERLEGDACNRLATLMSEETAALMKRHGPRPHLCTSRRYPVRVERRLAGIGAWYELMPRSQSGSTDRHGTFDDVIDRLPYVRDLGFDVLYLPPIHPIGSTHRKGRNNSLTAVAGDPGSPYAIGSPEGGHDALHPELGDFDDFARLVEAAHEHGLEIALDFAIQCSPDHPWIEEHPEWFDWRPDGTIKYAENPPKKYEDIVNVHFYREALPSIWFELRDVVLFWVAKGVKIFRVDNPHTKPFPFWEWLIGDVQARHPETIFLSEAFTRPKVMKALAKLGFTQSYSYFTWRNTKQELTEYLVELTRGDCRLYMRPNFFTNTPDINPLYLQTSGRAGFQVRLVLAATLATSYGIYNGFELCESAALPGKEEYLNSEKYEIRAWDWDRPGNIREDVALVNRLRRENPALWEFENLTFLNAWNDDVLAYYKLSGARDNCVVVAVNLNPDAVQSADFEIPLWEFGLGDDAAITVVDLVGGGGHTWHGKIQNVTLDPAHRPYAIWRLQPPGFAS